MARASAVATPAVPAQAVLELAGAAAAGCDPVAGAVTVLLQPLSSFAVALLLQLLLVL